jgi:hypothetical protein
MRVPVSAFTKPKGVVRVAAPGLRSVRIPYETVEEQTITVTTVADGGEGSLREAMQLAGRSAAPTRIEFASSLAGATIRPTERLPILSRGGTTIDGDVDDDGSPDITIDGSGSGVLKGLLMSSPGNHLTGLAVCGFGQFGIQLHTPMAHNNRITGCNVGMGADGKPAADGQLTGILLFDGPHDNQIGEAGASRNTIAGNKISEIDFMCERTTGNRIAGSVFTTEVDGETVCNGTDVRETKGAAGNEVRLGRE